MRIALVRHGRPLIARSGGISAHGLTSWIEAYDRAEIDPALPPPENVRRIAEGAAFLVSSDLPRAVASARASAPERPARAEPIFREAGLPRLPSTPVRLHPQAWAVVARVGWFLGWSGGTEGFLPARARAKRGAELLATFAEQHESVALFGHGIFNGLLAGALLASGWRGTPWPSGRYWSSAVYRKG